MILKNDRYWNPTIVRGFVALCLLCLANAVVGAAPPALDAKPGMCSAVPDLGSEIYGYLANQQTSLTFVQRLQNDPTFAAKLGNPVARRSNFADTNELFAYQIYLRYPPLDDPDVIVEKLLQTGEFSYLSVADRNTCFATPPADQPATFVEYYNAQLDHYFYSGNAQEISAIDAGKVGAWTRTGESFRALVTLGCFIGRSEGVAYRFYGIPGKGPNSHFFTTDRAECYSVDKSGQWMLEGIPFYANTPVEGSCSGRGQPLYRVWKPNGESNHRFTTKLSVVEEMRARGWVVEGVAMCLTA